MTDHKKLELHYFFYSDTHLIDAVTRHKCEAEILEIAQTIIKTFKLDVEIQVEPPVEGGFRDFWNFIGNNNTQLNFLGSLMAIGISVAAFINSLPDEEKEKLRKENIQLDNELKRLQIQDLKAKLSPSKELKDSVINTGLSIIQNDLKLVKRRSNLYQHLKKYSSVKEVSFIAYDGTKIITKTDKVQRQDFDKFILKTDELPTITVDNAIVEIEAPVLKKKNRKWFGIYEGEPISFSMRDKEFIKSVVNKEVNFHNEYYIECILKIKQKLDDAGEVKEYGHEVTLVLGKIEDQSIIATEQGKQYKKEKELLSRQAKLF